jgi:hypothetical protein
MRVVFLDAVDGGLKIDDGAEELQASSGELGERVLDGAA